ncbi:hypothetical protein DIZ29_11620 [Acinetobacter baumannii]|nr:hypothetical protein DIZ29_11620 [Acinetobacter baumannii]
MNIEKNRYEYRKNTILCFRNAEQSFVRLQSFDSAIYRTFKTDTLKQIKCKSRRSWLNSILP